MKTALQGKIISLSRNHPCPCVSGKKYKKCCLRQEKKPTDAEVPFCKLKYRLGHHEPERKPMGYIFAKMADRLDEIEMLPAAAREYTRENSGCKLTTNEHWTWWATYAKTPEMR